MTITKMNYGKALRILRAAVPLTRTELAHRAHLDPSYICMIEGGLRNPGKKALERICGALKVSPYLLTFMALPPDELRVAMLHEDQTKAAGKELFAYLLRQHPIPRKTNEDCSGAVPVLR